ncbi:unnamed protein product [Tuber aestivum]|uniref:Uncharacterized protein n=1 Tax=Tuber aestivum TaxID=59557 RepID=A0A292Q5W3_9PEZI|nr:unnamed protein product [Tuber aestivum]
MMLGRLVRCDVIARLDFCILRVGFFWGAFVQISHRRERRRRRRLSLSFTSFPLSLRTNLSYLFHLSNTSEKSTVYYYYPSLLRLIIAISRLDMSTLFRSSGILERAVVSSARPTAAVVGSGGSNSSSSSKGGRFMGTSARHDNDPEVLERNKQSILRKHAKGSTEHPHWHEELATDSEAFVKAYRGETEASEGEIEKLQQAANKVLDAKNNVKG